MWRPIATDGGTGEARRRANDYYFGCAPGELRAMRRYLTPSSPGDCDARRGDGERGWVGSMNSSDLVTVGSAGSIMVRVHSQHSSYGEERGGGGGGGEHDDLRRGGPRRAPVLRETIDQVLLRVRRNRRGRMLREGMDGGGAFRWRTGAVDDARNGSRSRRRGGGAQGVF